MNEKYNKLNVISDKLLVKITRGPGHNLYDVQCAHHR